MKSIITKLYKHDTEQLVDEAFIDYLVEAGFEYNKNNDSIYLISTNISLKNSFGGYKYQADVCNEIEETIKELIFEQNTRDAIVESFKEKIKLMKFKSCKKCDRFSVEDGEGKWQLPYGL
jgi:hypothetical protein